MGQEIVYCFQCQTRIVGADFDKGRAFQIGDRVSCVKCASELLHTLPVKEREQLLKQMFTATHHRRASGSSTQLPAINEPTASSTGRKLTSSSSKMRTVGTGPPGGVERRKSGNTVRRLWERRSRRSLAMAVAGAAGMAVVVLLMLRSSGGAGPIPAQEASDSKTSAPDPGAGPVAEHEEIRKARTYARDNPRDLDGQIAQWRGVLLVVDPKSGEPVQKELDRLIALQKESVAKALAELDAEARPRLEKEEFVAAAGLFQAARPRFSSPEWTLAVDRRIEKTRSEPTALLGGIREKAADARRRGAANEFAELEARVRRWGRPDLLDELGTSLNPDPGEPSPAPAPASVPATSREVDMYRVAWQAAFSRAAAGDLSGAAQDLTAASSGVPEGPGRSEALEDQEALRRASAAVQEVRDALDRTPKGQRLSVERWDAFGTPEKIEGTVLGTEPGRLLLRSDSGTVALEIGELTPVGLADQILARAPRKPGDDRTAALLALLGGDQDRAARTGVALPDRWQKLSSRAAAAVSGGHEAEARRLYAEAEECAADPTRVATALRNYKTLLTDFASTAFVTRNKTSLGGHTNLGKEYHFFSETLRGTGTFKLTKGGRLDSAWLSERDADASAAPQNFVELSFTALPDLEYRLWVYAGACCLETFAFGVQGTDMVLPSARSTSAEPGGSAWVPVRPSPPLKKTHAMHGGPKTPARWEWIPLPLPKFSSPGVKVVHLLTDQKGFAVAYALVSSASTSAPRESDVKELQKIWSLKREGMTPPGAPAAGLVGYWPMDEGSGAAAADASGKTGPAAVRGATWTTGHIGSGLSFDGQKSHVELPRTPTLDGLNEGSYTLSAWYRPDRLPPGKDDQFDASDGILIRCGLHGGLSYGNNGSFGLTHWLIDPQDGTKAKWFGVGTKPFPPGVFYHVVGVVDRAAGTLTFYVNGRPESSGTFPPNAPAWKYGPDSWRVGISRPDYNEYRWPAKGVIDNVHIYNRALAEPEVVALYHAPRGSRVSSAPAAPEPDGRPWKPIFDGRTADLVSPGGPTAWVVKDGALVHVAGVDNALRTNDAFGDGELRVRYEARGLTQFWLTIRQVDQAGYTVSVSRGASAGLDGTHEILFTCRGETVTATFDGQPVGVEKRGESRSGPLQLNCNVEGTLALRSVEFREAK